jgi:hypothetical protein
MKSRLNSRIILLLILVPFATSCEKPKISDDPYLLEALYTNSLDTLTIENNRYFLETDLSRNMMPGGPIPTKRRLSALVFLVRADSLAISTNITAGKLYVINYPQIWISKPGDSNISQGPDYKLAKISIDGPEWDTDIYVDVVIEVVNNSTNDSYLLIARHQYIQKLE